MSIALQPRGVWFPTVRAGTGVDLFTIRLADGLRKRGIRAEICWLPHRAEFLPWSVAVPRPPNWVDVVHINSWMPSRFIPRHMPLVVTLHSCVHDAALDPYKSILQRLYHRTWVLSCEQHALHRAAAITAVSQYTADEARAIFGDLDIDTIPNGVDTSTFHCCDRSAIHKPFRLLFVGHPSRRKGADLLGSILRELGDDFELAVTGSLAGLGDSLPANIRSLGYLSDAARLAEHYRNSDALLFPSRLEGLSLACLEAQSCGLPIIATNCSSMPEIVVEGETGLLCPQDDVQAFVSAARRMRNEPMMWEAMRSAARQRATKHFSESEMIDRYLAVYRRACPEGN